MRTRRERLEEFSRRLGAAPASASHGEARRLVARILTEVEDEMSGVPCNPHPSDKPTDGRMYPPMDDKIFDIPGRPAVKRCRSRHHSTFIGDNGALEIQNLEGAIVFAKPGADGMHVRDL